MRTQVKKKRTCSQSKRLDQDPASTVGTESQVWDIEKDLKSEDFESKSAPLTAQEDAVAIDTLAFDWQGAGVTAAVGAETSGTDSRSERGRQEERITSGDLRDVVCVHSRSSSLGPSDSASRHIQTNPRQTPTQAISKYFPKKPSVANQDTTVLKEPLTMTPMRSVYCKGDLGHMPQTALESVPPECFSKTLLPSISPPVVGQTPAQVLAAPVARCELQNRPSSPNTLTLALEAYEADNRDVFHTRHALAEPDVSRSTGWTLSSAPDDILANTHHESTSVPSCIPPGDGHFYMSSEPCVYQCPQDEILIAEATSDKDTYMLETAKSETHSLEGAYSMNCRIDPAEFLPTNHDAERFEEDWRGVEYSWHEDRANCATNEENFYPWRNAARALTGGGDFLCDHDLEARPFTPVSSDNEDFCALTNFSEGRALLLGLAPESASNASARASKVSSAICRAENNVARALRNHWQPVRF